MEDLLCGTILSGSVLCLDEFNRLNEKMMAWMANHFLGINQSIFSGIKFIYEIHRRKKYCNILNILKYPFKNHPINSSLIKLLKYIGSFYYQINDLKMRIKPSTAFFVTMNPTFWARFFLFKVIFLN